MGRRASRKDGSMAKGAKEGDTSVRLAAAAPAPDLGARQASRGAADADNVPAARIIPFHSDRPGKKFREFSNSFRDAPPFRFRLPKCARRAGFPDAVECEFSDKAIMLTKAALMGDADTFAQIEAAGNPKDCWSLGRAVRNFDQRLWDTFLEEAALEAVGQKFEASQALSDVLLSTGEAILAEAYAPDSIWGIGMSADDVRVQRPEQWPGRNLLGFTLMKVRSHLRGEQHLVDDAPSDLGSAGAAPSTTAANPSSGLSAVEENFLRPITDLAAVRACFEEHGLVAVTGCLSPLECERLVNDGFEPYLPSGCRMSDVETFGMADEVMNRFGVVGKTALFNPAILSARLHPNVASAFSAVHGTDEVFACHDRFAWMRPTFTNAAWDTPFSWPGLHFDVSLRSYFEGSQSAVEDFLSAIDYGNGHFTAENNAKHVSMGRTVQGVLNVFDNEEEDGGFQCVPGMHGKALREWVSRHSGLPGPEVNGKYELKDFGPDRHLGKHAVRVPCPAGTLILFDATLPHGTKPNASARSRAILFLRYLTATELPPAAWRNRNVALRRVVESVGFEPDERQARHLYGPA